jgi:hypothetical protein
MFRLGHSKKKKEYAEAVTMKTLFEEFMRQAPTRVHKHLKSSQLAFEGRLYRVFLEMYELLEYYGPLWYPEALHRRVEAVIRECSPLASKGKRTKPPLRQEARAHAVH